MLTAALALAAAVVGCGSGAGPKDATRGGSTAAGASTTAISYSVPADSLIPAGEVGQSIRRGRAILLATADSLPHHVGNALRCTSCHLDGGTRAASGSWVGVYVSFPQYNARGARVFRIEDRINECFRRSLNGKPLPVESRDMTDMVSYFAFLSRGIMQGTKPAWLGLRKITAARAADAQNGARLYAQGCARCHGPTGEGMTVGDPSGKGTMFAPPVWGPRSFAIGAGMARLNTAAAFIRWNMPFDRPGTLGDQDAFDVAAFVLAHPRPDTPGKDHDWPRGGRPSDCPYPTLGSAQSMAVAGAR